MRVSFSKVSVKGTKRWKDPATGKPRTQTREFFQTISPFNKNADGSAKTSEEILVEVQAERDEWMHQGEQP